MPKALRLPDGRVLRAPGDIPVEAFDPIAQGVLQGGAPPQGFTIEGEQAFGPPQLGPVQGAQPGLDPTQLRQQPVQQFKEAVGPYAAGARDVATEAITKGLQFQAPRGMETPALRRVQQIQEPIAQTIAQSVVPQTPGQLISTIVLGTVGAGAGAGVAGALARAFLPAAANVTTQAILDESVNPGDAMAEIMGAAIGEGMPGVASLLSRGKVRQAALDRVGDAWAEELGRSLGEVTSVKGMKLPLHFEELLSGKNVHETLFHQHASNVIGKERDAIKDALGAAFTQLPPPQQTTARLLLEKGAGVERQMSGQAGSNTAIELPQTLLEKAFHRAALAGQKARALEGAEKWEAAQEAAKIVGDIRGALAMINPELEARHVASNIQYARDLDALDMLWRMKEENAWYSKTDRVHLDPVKVSKVLKDSIPTVERTGLMGGMRGTQRFVAGPHAELGSAPTTHEEIMRAFLATPGLGAATSIVINPKLMTMPITSPVRTGRAKALSDFMASSGLRAAGSGLGSQILPMEGAQ